MSEHSIKLSGQFNVPEPVMIDHSYNMTLEGSVTSISKHSEENGDFSYVYTLKPIFGEIQSDKGEVLKLKKKGSLAQVLRFKIQGLGLDYDKEMSKIIDSYDN